MSTPLYAFLGWLVSGFGTYRHRAADRLTPARARCTCDRCN